MTEEAARELAGRVRQVLERFCRQNGGGEELAETIEIVAERMAEIARERAANATPELTAGAGEPAEMSAAEVVALVTRLLAGVHGGERMVAPVKQLVKGCFQAARKNCRDSYREVDGAGVCRRQLLAKARERVSGTHCVDCPYWTQLSAEQHGALLAYAWVSAGGLEEFAANRELFLPEDFRELRRIAMGGEMARTAKA